MRIYQRLFLILPLFVLSACGGSSSNGSSIDETADAQYRVTFTANWNDTEFPPAPSSAHFSPLIGATHKNAEAFWSEGGQASSGMKSVAETGKTSSFQTEVSTAQDSGEADYLIKGSGLSTGSGSVTKEFSINQSHSLVTLITMIAPSPDWFIGVNGLDLYDSSKGEWKQTVTVDLKTYDAGTEEGTGFSISNAATSPQETIEILDDETNTVFKEGVHKTTLLHIGSFTFEKI